MGHKKQYTYSLLIIVYCDTMNDRLPKGAKIWLSKGICYFKNQTNLSIKINNLGSHFWSKCFLITSTLETQTQAQFLTVCHLLYSQKTMISFEYYVDFRPKIMLFRSHHQRYSITDLTLTVVPLIVWTCAILKKWPF